MPDFFYQKPYPTGRDHTPYRLLSKEFVSVEESGGRRILKVAPEGLELLAREAFADVSFYLRPQHLSKLKMILEDPEASDNDRFVAHTMLQPGDIRRRAASHLPGYGDGHCNREKRGKCIYRGE